MRDISSKSPVSAGTTTSRRSYMDERISTAMQRDWRKLVSADRERGTQGKRRVGDEDIGMDRTD